MKESTCEIIDQKILTGKDPSYTEMMSPCGAGIVQLLYNYNGDIYTCDEARMIGSDLFLLGSVKKNKYKEVLTSDNMCAVLAASVNDTKYCDSCAYKPFCGLCPVCSYAETGNIISSGNHRRCRIYKSQFDFVFDKLACKR